MAQASQAAGGDYPSGTAGGLGSNYYDGGSGSSTPDTSGQGGAASVSSIPDNAAQLAPATGDILGFNDPSQTYTMPDAVNTPAVEASTAQGGNASGDQTVPQAIDKQASVESTAIASAATAQSKAITSAQTSADKSASSLAQQAIKSAQSIASGQQASSKEQTASNQAASQTMLSQVKDLFVRFFLGAGGLVLIAAAVWYFAGRPTPPMPVMRAVH
jgi:vacuolar-type H+-ATPase subunit H